MHDCLRQSALKQRMAPPRTDLTTRRWRCWGKGIDFQERGKDEEAACLLFSEGFPAFPDVTQSPFQLEHAPANREV